MPCSLVFPTLLQHMKSVAAAPICHNSHRNSHKNIQSVQKQLLGELPTKIELQDRCFASASCLRVAGIHLCHPTNESELPHGPPFCCPDLLQTNRIMPLIVVIVDPMFCATVPAERLGIVEQPPVAIDLLHRLPTDHANSTCECGRAGTSKTTTFLSPLPTPAALARARPSTWKQKKIMLSRQQAPTSWSSVHVQGHPGDFPGAWVGHATK